MVAERPEGPTKRALRLTFDYDGDDIVQRRSERIEKRVPPSDPLLREGEAASRSGFWIELTDEDGRAVWRRVMEDPRAASAEAPAGDRPGELTRATINQPKGSFRVLLPDRRDGRNVAVVASPWVPGARPGRAHVLGRFDLVSGKRIGPEPGRPAKPTKKRHRKKKGK